MPEPIRPLGSNPELERVEMDRLQTEMSRTNFIESMRIQTQFVEEVNKSKRENWLAMAESTKEYRLFAASGGLTSFMGGPLERIKSTISNTIEGLFAPITNEMTKLVSDLTVVFVPAFQEAAKVLGDAISDLTNLMDIKLPGGKNITDWVTGLFSGLLGIITNPRETIAIWWHDFWSAVLGKGGSPYSVPAGSGYTGPTDPFLYQPTRFLEWY